MNLLDKPATTALLVCVHAVKFLGWVVAFDDDAALDFGDGIYSFFFVNVCTVHEFSIRAGDFEV